MCWLFNERCRKAYERSEVGEKRVLSIGRTGKTQSELTQDLGCKYVRIDKRKRGSGRSHRRANSREKGCSFRCWVQEKAERAQHAQVGSLELVKGGWPRKCGRTGAG